MAEFEIKKTPLDIRTEASSLGRLLEAQPVTKEPDPESLLKGYVLALKSVLGEQQPEERAGFEELVAEIKWKQSSMYKWIKAAELADWAVVPTSSGIYRGPIWR